MVKSFILLMKICKVFHTYNEIFYMPSRYMLEKEAKRLMSRLFQIDHSKEMSATAVEEEKQSSSEVTSFSSQLSNALTNACICCKIETKRGKNEETVKGFWFI